jgi:RNA polymerase-binding transcription factor DksA
MSALTTALSPADVRALTDLLQQHRSARLDQLSALALQGAPSPRALSVAQAAADDVAAAFGRLADGSYGWCRQCTGPIPREHLYAAPTVADCPDCAC